jgi:hypothetical protein
MRTLIFLLKLCVYTFISITILGLGVLFPAFVGVGDVSAWWGFILYPVCFIIGINQGKAFKYFQSENEKI